MAQVKFVVEVDNTAVLPAGRDFGRINITVTDSKGVVVDGRINGTDTMETTMEIAAEGAATYVVQAVDSINVALGTSVSGDFVVPGIIVEPPPGTFSQPTTVTVSFPGAATPPPP